VTLSDLVKYLMTQASRGPTATAELCLNGSYIALHYIKSYLECPKSLGPLEHYMKLKE